MLTRFLLPTVLLASTALAPAEEENPLGSKEPFRIRMAEEQLRNPYLRVSQLADESVRLYETAIRFLWEHIDKKSGHMKARWGGANCRRRGIGLFSPKTCAPENHRW